MTKCTKGLIFCFTYYFSCCRAYLPFYKFALLQGLPPFKKAFTLFQGLSPFLILFALFQGLSPFVIFSALLQGLSPFQKVLPCFRAYLPLLYFGLVALLISLCNGFCLVSRLISLCNIFCLMTGIISLCNIFCLVSGLTTLRHHNRYFRIPVILNMARIDFSNWVIWQNIGAMLLFFGPMVPIFD